MTKLTTKEMILVALFAALSAVGAFITIPLPFVPFTLQTFFCAFAGMLLGARLGGLSQLIYVLVGLAGVPIFTKGGGLSYVLQPTFGYLIGFIVTTYVIGKMTERQTNLGFKYALFTVFVGMGVTYLIGVPYLYLIFNYYMHQPITVWVALGYGFFPFVGGDIVKNIFVAFAATRAIPVLRKNGLMVAARNCD